VFNKIILAGYLTREPEVRYSQQGLTVCTFGLAVNTDSKQTDESKKETLFIDVITFGKTAEACGQYLNKGKGVIVDGRLKERRWETEEGQKRSKCEVIATTVKFLPKKVDVATTKTDDYIPDDITVEDPF
jgi:single-strand DNA-binding protein